MLHVAIVGFIMNKLITLSIFIVLLPSSLGPVWLQLLGSSPVVTPILGCNMAILVAIWMKCIYVWSLAFGCIWNGAIGSCILLSVVLQYSGFATHKNGCMSYCCDETHGCNMRVLPWMNLLQNSFIATPQLRGNMAILPCSVLHCIKEILQYNKIGGSSHNCHIHLLVAIKGNATNHYWWK